MKAIIPPILTIALIVAIMIFVNVFPIGGEWLKSEADFNLLSPLFIIRNGILILLGVLFAQMFANKFSGDSKPLTEVSFLLPLIVGVAGGAILVILTKPLWFPQGNNIWLIILFLLITVVAEELYFRAFITETFMKISNPSGFNLIALIFSSILYALWLLTYAPIVRYSFIEIAPIGLLYLIIISLPITASYYYTRSVISSGITNALIKGMYLAYCLFMMS